MGWGTATGSMGDGGAASGWGPGAAWLPPETSPGTSRLTGSGGASTGASSPGRAHCEVDTAYQPGSYDSRTTGRSFGPGGGGSYVGAGGTSGSGSDAGPDSGPDAGPDPGWDS